ncbi:MAG: Spy/CpxP family protein refolding chaperone [Planctomycetaceae bacterium]|nr:Spy/CpxP family protein refolding chaperone [Planctomycetaceae bacterium]
MKHVLSVVAMAFVALTASYAMAQAEADQGQDAPPPQRQPGPPLFIGPIPDQALASLDLTAEQKKQIEEIRAANKQAMQEWMKNNEAKLKETMDKVRAAEEAGQTDQLKELRDQVKALYDSRRELAVACNKKIEGVLTDQQKAKMRQTRTRGGRRTQEQQGQGRQEGQDARGGQRGAKGQRGGEAQRGGQERGDQRGPAGMMPMGPMGVANLTPEQRQKIRAIMEEAQKKIHDEVLTDEQRAAIEKMKNRLGAREGGQGRDAQVRPGGEEGGDQQAPRERSQRGRRRGPGREGGESAPAPAPNE